MESHAMLENHPVSHKACTENHLYSSSKAFFLDNCQFVNLESHSSLSLPLKLDTVVKAAECFYLRFYLRWLPFVIGHILKVGVKRAKYQLKPFYSSNLINFCLSLPTALNEDSTEVATHHEILKSLNICFMNSRLSL